MRVPLAGILFLAVATPGLAQFSTNGRCSDSSATIQVSTQIPVRMRAVTGAPYSARQTHEMVQTFADGTHETSSEAEDWTWRDSSGRVRTEIRKGEAKRAPCRSVLIEIEDPVGGFAYLVNPVDRIAYRVALVATPAPARHAVEEPDAEPLGTKTMSGVPAEGTLTKSTRPNGSTVTDERWISPQLGLPVYEKNSDSRGTDSTTTLRDLSTAEPDASLFQIPADYRIVNETGPFTVEVNGGVPTPRRTAPDTSPLVAHPADKSTSPVPLRSFGRFLVLEGAGDHAAAISLGDVNGDGNLDAVLSTGRHWESPIRLYFGDGKGGFKPIGDIGTQGYASYGVPLADLNGDGLLDLAVGTDAGGNKPIFFGDGKGHFTLAGSFGDPGMPSRNIAVGDLNGDGHPDIAIANRGTQSYVYLNDGKGGFAEERPFGGPHDSTVTVAIADVDHDGKPDLVIARRDGQQSVALINDGHGNFSDPRPFGPADADTRAVAVGDLNGDGYPDVVACHLGLGTFVYFNDGHGNFGKPVRIAGSSDQFYSLAIADMNRDGKPDIVGGNVGKPNAVFFNEKDGTSFGRVEFGDANAGSATYGLAIADVDKDGYPDIAVARTGADSGIFFSSEFRAELKTTEVKAAASRAAFSIAIRQAASGKLMRDLFGSAYGIEPARVEGDGLSGNEKFNVSVTPGSIDPKDAAALLQEALCAYFHVTVTHEARGASEVLIVARK
jgi:hypothetical protein